MSHLHLWMQACSNQGETWLDSVESTDKFDNSTYSVDCSEASLYQALHRTTAHDPLRRVEQMQEQMGSEAWHAIARRMARGTCQTTTQHTQHKISNLSERDRAKDVEQLDDILTTSINETSKFENRFGKIRDE